MLKIWGRVTSSNVQKVLWAADELRLPYEQIDVGGAFGGLNTPEFAALNPMRMIPVIDDNGFRLWESNAIVRYLAETYGRGSLASQDRQAFALADQWMDWNATSIQPDIITTLFWGLIRTPATQRNGPAITAAAKRAGEKLAVLDAHLKDRSYICGTTLSMADIPIGGMMYRYFTMPIDRPSLPNVEAWYGRLAARPAYAKNVIMDYSSLRVPGA